jgi:hypothetical protein
MEDGDRVLVRYPKGSEYRVKRSNLIPVLEDCSRLVIIAAETPEYRRASVVHTCVGECFLEIGCDFGPTVDRVQRALTQVSAVPHVAGKLKEDAGVVPYPNDERVFCLGVDKSPESIDIAVSRFPDCCFSVEDALTDEGTVRLRSLCKNNLICGYPCVVAIDINGNREIPAVLQCIRHVMNPGKNVDLSWKLPRLIIVKSRLLYHELKRQQGKEA